MTLIPTNWCATLIASLAASFLAGRAHGDRSISAPPMQKDHMADLARRTGVGDLAIVSMGEKNGERRAVVDVLVTVLSALGSGSMTPPGYKAYFPFHSSAD